MKDFKKCYNSKTMVKNEKTWLYEIRNEYKWMKLKDYITSNAFEDDITDKSFDDMMSDNIAQLLSERKSILNDVVLKRNIVDLEGTTWDSVKFEFDWLVYWMRNAYWSIQNQHTQQYTTWYSSAADSLRLITTNIEINTLKAEYLVTKNLLEDTFYNVWEKVQTTILRSYLKSFDEAYYDGQYWIANSIHANPQSSQYAPANVVNKLWAGITAKKMLNMYSMIWEDTWSDPSELTFHMNQDTYIELLKSNDVQSYYIFWKDTVNATWQLAGILWAKIYVSKYADDRLLNTLTPQGYQGEPIMFLTCDRYSAIWFKRQLEVESQEDIRKWWTYVVWTTRYWVTVLENFAMYDESKAVDANGRPNYVVVAAVFMD